MPRHAHCANDASGATNEISRTTTTTSERGQPPSAERHGRVAPHARRGAVPQRAAHASFDGDGDDRQDQEQRRCSERLCPIEQARCVDHSGQRVEAEQLHGAELAQAVQQRDQHSAEHRAANRGQDDPEEEARRSITEQAGTLLDRRRQTCQTRGDRQVHVGVGERREHEARRARARGSVSARRRRPRSCTPRIAPSGPESGDESRGADERREDQRQRRQQPQDSSERNVGAHQQPRQSGADDAGREADDDGQLDRSPQAVPSTPASRR